MNIISVDMDVSEVLNGLDKSRDEVKEGLYDICKYYAAEVLAYFVRVQTSTGKDVGGEYWTNRTFRAAQSFYAEAYEKSNTMGLVFGFGAGVDYAKYLEAWSGMIPSVLEQFKDAFFADVRKFLGT